MYEAYRKAGFASFAVYTCITVIGAKISDRSVAILTIRIDFKVELPLFRNLQDENLC